MTRTRAPSGSRRRGIRGWSSSSVFERRASRNVAAPRRLHASRQRRPAQRILLSSMMTTRPSTRSPATATPRRCCSSSGTARTHGRSTAASPGAWIRTIRGPGASRANSWMRPSRCPRTPGSTSSAVPGLAAKRESGTSGSPGSRPSRPKPGCVGSSRCRSGPPPTNFAGASRRAGGERRSGGGLPTAARRGSGSGRKVKRERRGLQRTH